MSYPGEIERRERRSPLAPLLSVIVFVALMWAVEIVDQIPALDLDRYGIRPRHSEGLIGVVTAPLLHGGFDHLMANTGAFLVLGGLVALTTRRFWPVTVGVALIGGFATWLTASPFTNHIGASGLVYGFAAFLVAWGLLTRRVMSILVAVIVVVMYGGIVVGLLPGQPGVSWQGHLFGAVAGVLMAFFLRDRRSSPS